MKYIKFDDIEALFAHLEPMAASHNILYGTIFVRKPAGDPKVGPRNVYDCSEESYHFDLGKRPNAVSPGECPIFLWVST